MARRGEHAGGDTADVLALVAAALAAREPPDLVGALAYYRDALEHATRLGQRPLAARCHLGLARLHRRRGESGRAREHLDITLAALNGMGMTLWKEQAEQERETLADG